MELQALHKSARNRCRCPYPRGTQHRRCRGRPSHKVSASGYRLAGAWLGHCGRRVEPVSGMQSLSVCSCMLVFCLTSSRTGLVQVSEHRVERLPCTTIGMYLPGKRPTEECAITCDRAECDQYVASLWDWLEGLGTGIQRNDPASWTPDRWPPTYRGILNTLEVAHQAFVWRVRKQKRVCKVQRSCHMTDSAKHASAISDHI